ncbi:type II toxin-antitoxin system PemK/MazF family toxin [Microbacterium hominis]|uniref:type II toxin-antitoxin system PemK/MazF family toxin n=1 Tax=Microbacterium hominis TaxID=162426 RepID=UPI003F6832A3
MKPSSSARSSARVAAPIDGRAGATATVEIRPPAADALRITYAPERDGDPDAGEIVWTWVPYAENDGRGKDRPVLVIGRQDADRVYAVRLTSRSHEGDRDYLAIGSGPWDGRGRDSWVDVDQLYSVHRRGMRREAAALDLDRFVRVADVLHRRYGWAVGE